MPLENSMMAFFRIQLEYIKKVLEIQLSLWIVKKRRNGTVFKKIVVENKSNG